ncbi:hypothetical protein Ciccas_003105 [Cichlidogyrus casuarinus]|uniref:EGF-like domain-containing protein n=1 Tax=Cichlidogyrus casuarinus TaxID=1844966 RepID=A0ABD2QFC5_9PLAT
MLVILSYLTCLIESCLGEGPRLFSMKTYTKDTRPAVPVMAYPYFIGPYDMIEPLLRYSVYGLHPNLQREYIFDSFTSTKMEQSGPGIVVEEFKVERYLRLYMCMVDGLRRYRTWANQIDMKNISLECPPHPLTEEDERDQVNLLVASHLTHMLEITFKEFYFWNNKARRGAKNDPFLEKYFGLYFAKGHATFPNEIKDSDLTRLFRYQAWHSTRIDDLPIAILMLEAYSGFHLARHFLDSGKNYQPNGLKGQTFWPPANGIYKFYGPMSGDSMSVTFLVYLCKVLRSQPKSLVDPSKDIPHNFCPNPCIGDPCSGKQHTIPGTCEISNYGLFLGNFKCACKTGFSWKKFGEDENLSENEKGFCAAVEETSSFCHSEGTRKLHQDSEAGTFWCECLDSHTGDDCGLLRNPCFRLGRNVQDKELMHGNLACNVAQGNRCLPTLGTDEFLCLCIGDWERDNTYRFQNCLARKDICESVVCNSGVCISSADGKNFLCKCPDSTHGQFCENSAGTWGEWSPWNVDEEAGFHCSCEFPLRSVKTRLRKCLGIGCKNADPIEQIDPLAIDYSGEIQTEVISGIYFPKESEDGSMDPHLQENFAILLKNFEILANFLLLTCLTVMALIIISFLLKLYLFLRR